MQHKNHARYFSNRLYQHTQQIRRNDLSREIVPKQKKEEEFVAIVQSQNN